MTDIEIAKNANLENINVIAKDVGLEEDEVEYYGKLKAKIEFIKQTNVDKLILTHFSPRYTNTNDLLTQAREEFKNSDLAHDLMVINI